MKSTSGTRKPYSGSVRSLVLALDIGTTFSGVSYAILEPGEVPKIHGVTRFPGQEHVAGNSKIPSIMYYDRRGNMKAAGAEAESASIIAQAEDEGWVKAELFKLRLRPKTMKLKMNGMRLASLPAPKTAVDVFGDFLAYLFHCTRSFIVDTHANGPALWRAVEHDIQFVLSHPNGWEGAQQAKMRRAAEYGGLIPDTDEGKARIRFVTEGEASLHACVLNGLAADVLSNPSGHGFIVADAGGGTLDISSYAIRGTAPLVIEEIAPPDCVFAGSVFVSRRARAFFEQKLKGSKYGSAVTLDHIAKRFDETTKRLFREPKELQFVPFGSPLDKDSAVGIRGGQLKLTGAEVAAMFESSIEAAISSIQNQIATSGGAIRSVWLVGGFAASPWLFSQLQERLAPMNVTVSRPDSQTSKAVADGAIGFYCDHHVSARMSKFMYGVEYLRQFDAADPEHVAREHRLFDLPSGPRLLPDAFDCILSRGVKVKESMVFSRKYCTEMTSLSVLSVFEVEIWCFRGGDTVPKWIRRDAEHFSTLCHVRADLSPLAGSAQAKQGRGGKTYWTIIFSIEIHFGLTEFKARIKWVDNGKTKYGPASIVYNESGHRAEEDEPDESPEDNISILSTSSGRQPSAQSSRTPSVHTSPTIPGTGGLSRSSSSGHSHIQSRSLDKGKARALDPSTPPPLDRSLNVSSRSVDSVRSGSTHLSEELNAVWGAPASHQTPGGSPRDSVAMSHRGTLAPVREEARAATPRAATAASHAPSVRESKAPTAREPRVRTPREVSKTPTTREPSVPPTPKEQLAASTPAPITREITVPATSQQPTAPATPKQPTASPTPKQSKPTTPKESKAPTPKETSRVATPKAVSKAPTPRETSKAPTPKEASRAATPKVTSRVVTPKPEPEPLVEEQPVAPPVEAPPVEVPPAEAEPASPVPPAPVESVDPASIEHPPEDTVPPAEPWGNADDEWDMDFSADNPETQVKTPVPAFSPLPDSAPASDPLDVGADFGTSTFGDDAAANAGTSMLESALFDSNAPYEDARGASAVLGGLDDLLSSPGPEPASKASTGMFSNFLSGDGWGGGASRPTSSFGGLGLGNLKSSFGSGFGFGRTASPAWGTVGDKENTAAEEKAAEEAAAAEQAAEERADAEAAEQAAKERAEAEAAEQAANEEAEADAAAERAAADQAAAEAEKQRQEEDAAAEAEKRQEEEQAKKLEDEWSIPVTTKGKKGKKGKSGAGTPAAISRTASAKQKEEEAKAEEERKKAEEEAMKAEEERIIAEEEAKKAEEEVKNVEEEGEKAAEKEEVKEAEEEKTAEEADAAQSQVDADAQLLANGAPNELETSPAAALVSEQLANGPVEQPAEDQPAQDKQPEADAPVEIVENLQRETPEPSPEETPAAQEGDVDGTPVDDPEQVEEVKADDDDFGWGVPVKKKKGKKGGAAAAPDPVSRATSGKGEGDAAPTGGGKKKGKRGR